jgi:hypothetical protein
VKLVPGEVVLRINKASLHSMNRLGQFARFGNTAAAAKEALLRRGYGHVEAGEWESEDDEPDYKLRIRVCPDLHIFRTHYCDTCRPR